MHPAIGPVLASRIGKVVPRARRFFNAQEPGHFLVYVDVPREWPPIPKLTEVNVETPEGLALYLDAQLESEKCGIRAKEGLDDDTIPSAAPYFGYSEHTAWTGSKVRWQENTSLGDPIISEPNQVDSLDVQEQSESFRRMKASYAYLRSKQDGTFLLAMRGCTSPMELANAVRGDEIFSDFIEDPEFVHRLLKRILQIYPRYLNVLRSYADEIEGGHVFGITRGWMGPNGMGHFSNDAAMLCGLDVYREFGLPYDQALTSHWDHVIYHVHTQNMHYLPELTKLSRLRLLQLQQDPGIGSNFEILDRILELTGSAGLYLNGSSDEVRKNIDRLHGRNVLFRTACESREDAEDLIALVRDRSR